MTQAERIEKTVGEFGASAKAKLANPASTGQPEDQLRAPLETLFTALAATMTMVPVGRIQPDHRLPEYTSELLNVLNVLATPVALEPKQADLLARVCDGPLIPAARFEKEESA